MSAVNPPANHGAPGAVSSRGPSGAWLLASRVLVAYAFMYCLGVLWRNRFPDPAFFESTAFLPLYLAAGVGVWIGQGAPGVERRERFAWRTISLGWLLSLAGALAWFLPDVPWLWRAGDLFYRAYYPLLVAGFLLLSAPSLASTPRARQWIDAAIIVITAITLSWYFVWGEPAVRAHLRANAPVDGIVPFGEVAVLVAAGVALTRTYGRPSRRAVEYLGGGALAASLGDLLLVRSDAVMSFALRSAGDIMLALSAILFMRSGIEAHRSATARRTVSSVLPYASLATVGLLLTREVAWGSQVSAASRGLIAGAIALSALVIVRLVLAEREARAEANARVEQERRFRALAQRSGEALLVVRQGVVTYASESVARIFDIAPDLVVGRPVEQLPFLGESDLLHAMHDPRDGTMVPWAVRAARGERFYETIVSDLRTDAAVNGLVLTTRDVSERVMLERRLLQTQKLDALGQLAGGVAHDFNNLLAAIRANVDLMRDAPSADPAHELVEITRATERGAALCQQLLAFGRPAEGLRQRFALAAALRATLPMLRRVLPSTISLDVAIDDDAAGVLADRAQVDVAILNVVLNARDAITGAGLISLRQSTLTLQGDEREPVGLAPGRYVALRVEDTGAGMDHVTLGRVFEPFFTTKGPGGTGLGLPMVYGVMKAAGGSVLITSVPGRGTVVTLYFPWAGVSQVDTSNPATSPTLRGAGRILLVDDERAVREVISKYLSRSGFEVVTASDGEEALAVLERERWHFDALVSDIVMPRVNGVELSRRVLAQQPQMRVILMSGFEPDAPPDGAAGESRIVRLQKPFSLETLLTHLQHAG